MTNETLQSSSELIPRRRRRSPDRAAHGGRATTTASSFLFIAITLIGTSSASADAVTDANAKAADIASAQRMTPMAVRTMAIVQVSVFEAVNAITARYPTWRVHITAAPGASVPAAVAAATRTALLELMPTQRAAIEANYNATLRQLPNGRPKADGVAVGEQAASAVLASCADDGSVAPDTYRPDTTAGVYVPTALPMVPHWGKRKPWVLTSVDQFRPGPPPSLSSDTWKRDLAEVKAIGAKNSTQRTPEQTAIARFWEATAPAVYWPVARAVAAAPGRDVTDNARLFAVAAMAMDDALIAVFDAKFTYNFWRPITAIRNGQGDARDPSWTPFIDTPMHPEYPCAHCILAGALGAVLAAEIGTDPTPTLRSASSTAAGAVRTWTSVHDFVQEVSSARIYDGVHYRTSTEVGSTMGAKIGDLATRKLPRATR
jgi:PAP2 superfamily protein